MPLFRPLLCLVLLTLGAHAQKGRFLPIETFHSTALEEERTVRIWLPPSYDSQPAGRFPVLYLHDGQNVFSSAGPHVAFGWGNWEVDRSVERLIKEKRMREIILVAVDNSPDRYAEYRGRAADYSEEEIESMRRRIPEMGSNRPFERYAEFLITELKPSIDERFRTLSEPTNTGVMGSSMGGIASLVLAWDHPEVFGMAASLSGAFQVEKRTFLETTLRTCTGTPKPLRLYLDSGRKSPGGDDGRANTLAVVTELRRIGWSDDANLLYHVEEQPLSKEELEPLGLSEGKFKEAQESQHNELYWRLRVWRALEFLFPPTGSP